jgi:hypothetical protein
MDFNQLLTGGITWPKALVLCVLILCVTVLIGVATK